MVVTHRLGVDSAGYFFLALAIFTFLSSVCRLGLDNSLIRFIGASKSECDARAVSAIITTSLFLIFIVSCAAALVVFLTSQWLGSYVFSKPELTVVLRGMAPSLVGLSLCFGISYCLQGLGKSKSAIFFQSIGIALFLISAGLFLNNVEDFAYWYSRSTLILMLVGLYVLRDNLSVRYRLHKIEVANISKSAKALWFVTIVTSLQQWGGQFIAGIYVESGDLAQFAVAQRTAMLISFILISTNMVVAPKFAGLYKTGDFKGLERVFRSSSRAVFCISAPLVFVVVVWAQEILSLFGPGFEQGEMLLRILALGQFVNAATGSVSYLLMMTGNERDSRNISFIAGPFAVLAAFVLTYYFGVVGTASSVALTVGMQNLLAVYFVKKRLGILSYPKLW
jgi:O-antigen/teichoic acid export membrane protein